MIRTMRRMAALILTLPFVVVSPLLSEAQFIRAAEWFRRQTDAS